MHSKPASFIRGLYFIRFPLSLWATLFLLAYLDRCTTGAASFTRGILTPESGPQAGTESFMIVSVGMIVLLLVRVIAVNGDERFETACSGKDGKPLPILESWLRRHLGQPDLRLWLFLAAHLAGAVLLAAVGTDINYEIADSGKVHTYFAAAALGILAAYLFWLFVGLIYYWTFDADTKNPVPREVIFPRVLIFFLKDKWISDIQTSPPPPLSDWLRWPFLVIARLGKEGFARPEDPDHLYEGHRLAFIAIVGLAVLYIFFFNYTAPVRITIPLLPTLTHGIAVLAVAFTLAGCTFGAWPKPAAARAVKIVAIVLLAACLLWLVGIWIFNTSVIFVPRAPRGFSVLGSILILVTGIFWILTTFSFAFDGTRLPILSVSLIGLLFLKACNIYPGEHYFTVVTNTAPFDPAPTPSKILDDRLAAPPQDKNADFPPLIVITAEGGGIHSAAWTANVLAELEKTFGENGTSFHSNILLASGVSGGSVGLLPFVREYTNTEAFPPPVKDANGKVISDLLRHRLTVAADCSSLQAIAWGLSYYDMLRFLAPFPLPTSPGIAPAKNDPVGPAPAGLDRSWALERSLARNLSDTACEDNPAPLPAGTKQQPDDPYTLTLNTTAKRLSEHTMPAFTFNTTAAETGGRFLLSNYELPYEPPPPGDPATDILPAESFLHAFGHGKTGAASPNPNVYADLPLPTAARLSATFPYVSSASRVPEQVSVNGIHFIDGGYYDNDGTASAMEFLYFALRHSKSLPELDCDALQSLTAKCKADKSKVPHGRRLPILLIEIRNESDISSNRSPESFAAQNSPDYRAKWGPDHQLLAPLEGFYKSGHASDTFRNRRELCVFEKAFQDRLDIHHIIFDYRNSDDGHPPLSWDLTPNQQKSIACAINPFDPKNLDCSSYQSKVRETRDHTIHNLAEDAAQWFKDPSPTKSIDETCKATGLDTIQTHN